MNTYVSIFDPIPWPEVGITFLQTFILYWVVLLGLKLVGRRAFGEMGPQELILLLLISEATDVGITHLDAGFWGTISSVVALLLTVWLVEQIRTLNRLLESTPQTLVRKGKLVDPVMKKHRIELEDLEKAARGYGVSNIRAFDAMILEGDGRITGVLKRNHPQIHLE